MKRLILALALLFPAPAAAGCHSLKCHHRVAHKQARAKKLAVIRPHVPWLRRTGDCENGPYGGAGLKEGLRAYNPSPFYGRYQFTMSTWHSVGGRGDPRDADWLEQAFRAVLVIRTQGYGAWPVCG